VIRILYFHETNQYLCVKKYDKCGFYGFSGLFHEPIASLIVQDAMLKRWIGLFVHLSRGAAYTNGPSSVVSKQKEPASNAGSLKIKIVLN